MTERRKTEPPLFLDMGFDEALGRFTRTKPAEVEESIARSKTKKPPGDDAPGGRLVRPAKAKRGSPGSAGGESAP